MIEVKNLTKTYAKVTALDNISFSLNQGEILGFLGPNGAGKTTVIHTLLGLLTPSSGEVSIFGMSPLDERHAISKQINFSSAYTQLPSNLTVIENMYFYARIYNVHDLNGKINSLLKLFEIAHLTKRRTGALSSGEKTRLNLCKCLLNDPKILLLDEPTASLDPEMADTVRKTLMGIQKKHKMAIIYTSHNMPEVEKICQRILFIHKGKIITQGTPRSIMDTFKSKTLEQVFIKLVRGGDLEAIQ
ncbi:ABC transporter ATP-binding protein [Elusimicrobiota bacterium]